MTVPKIGGIRWRYCTQWEEEPAAQLGKSLLRLGICQATDWSGSAVDFVEKGFKRFSRLNGADEAGKIWDGSLQIMDYPFHVTEQERHQSTVERDSPTEVLYLLGEYWSAASIPIGPTLNLLTGEGDGLAAAFYNILTGNLWTWMRVYDYRDAVDHAQMWLEGSDEQEIADSIYPKVEKSIPACLQKSKFRSLCRSVRFLEEIQPRLQCSEARQLVRYAVEMHTHGLGHEHPWPSKVAEEDPLLEEFLSDADDCGPGCLISWRENDEISACFEEEMQCLGQNAPMAPPILMTLKLSGAAREVDKEVKRVFDYIAAMCRSLALAAKIVSVIRSIHDEDIRRNRLKSGLSAESGTSGVREE